MSVPSTNGKVINPAKPLMIRTWRRSSLPYEEMEKTLKSGNAYFVSGIKRQTAHSAAQRLSKKVGFKVVAMSSIYEEEKGYSFFGKSLEAWVKKGKKEGWLTEEYTQNQK
jgi:hypothetical protein